MTSRICRKTVALSAGTVLGHAYYPLGTGLAGDVHYDNAEAWDASMFLETTVHEIGHAIGIAHSPLPTDALMNPIFASRYSGLGSAFLLQDDIDAVQSLYGERAGDTYTFQVGIEAGQTFEVAVANVDPQNLGIGDVDISTLSGAKDALVKISDATESVSKTRVTVGSGIKRFMSMLNSAIGLENNLAQVESRIRDVDIAKETTDLAMSQVLEGLGQKALVHHQEMVRAQASLVV